jgi:thiol-disulfide isomerase/thioredoxin
MTKATRSVLVLFCLFFILTPAGADAPQLEPNALWPAISLPVPADADERHYLGVTQGDTFAVGDMAAEVVIVQIFSMYCPICQREAPRVNQLYKLIDQRGDLSRRLKIIGIGAGNSRFEIDFYRRNYAIPFPLFADGEFVIHKKIGEVRTPHFFILKRDDRGQVRLVYAHSGGFSTPESFLEEIMRRCELK